MTLPQDRVFLDANVLFSAAYMESTSLLQLWKLDGVVLLTSEYAVEEARRNLASHRPAGVRRLTRLLKPLVIVSEGASHFEGIDEFPAKDRPIIGAAIAACATHLLTGDKRHFGKLFGKKKHGILVLAPSDYLRIKL